MLANVNALLEQEREKLSEVSKQFSRDPQFLSELLGKPYPKEYEPQSSILLMEEMEVQWSTPFHKKLREGTLELTQKEPEMQRNPLPNHKGKGVVAMVIHGNPAEAEESKGSFHPNTIRTLQKSPKFIILFNQLEFGLEARRMATESLVSVRVK
nr:hypothetical protein CFP56_37657 [Quercus suber]